MRDVSWLRLCYVNRALLCAVLDVLSSLDTYLKLLFPASTLKPHISEIIFFSY